MATPGQLVQAVARILGVDLATVTQQDRKLAEVGLRTVGGRGNSAAKVTAIDAANLLIAVTGSYVVKETLKVMEYADLPVKGGEGSFRVSNHERRHDGNIGCNWALSGFPIPQLQDLPETHTFRDALAALIESARVGSLQEAIRNLPGRDLGEGLAIPNLWKIEVAMWAPVPQSAIRIFSTDFEERHHYSRVPTDLPDLMEWLEEHPQTFQTGDLDQTRRFSHRAILAIGELLND